MAYCHQCGSKVAENDIFCPYCGISLQPTATGGNDDPHADTIVIEQTENAFGQAANAEAASREISRDKNSITGVADNYSSDVKETLDVSKRENIEILKPVDEDLPFAEEKQEASMSAAANEKIEIARQDAENSRIEQPAIIASVSEKEKIAETQNESSLMSYEEAEVKEGKDFEEAELPRRENLSNSA